MNVWTEGQMHALLHLYLTTYTSFKQKRGRATVWLMQNIFSSQMGPSPLSMFIKSFNGKLACLFVVLFVICGYFHATATK
jgi:hypothetical protein